MKKILAVAGGVVALCVLVVLGLAMTQPDTYRVERSRTLAAPPAVVWPLVSDFANFAKWSPWSKLDPQMKSTFTGTPGEVGHKYSWIGNSAAGSGAMTMTAVKANERIDIDLHFVEPFEDHATTSYLLQPVGEGQTKIVWSMDGHNTFVSKIMCVFMSFEEMIGKDYDEGLANLEQLVAKRS